MFGVECCWLVLFCFKEEIVFLSFLIFDCSLLILDFLVYIDWGVGLGVKVVEVMVEGGDIVVVGCGVVMWDCWRWRVDMWFGGIV